jgi:hypothetical protein
VVQAFSKEGLGRARYCDYPQHPKITGNALWEELLMRYARRLARTEDE